MIYLSQTLFLWWLAAFVLGLAFGLVPSRSEGTGRAGRVALLAAAIGVVAVVLNIVPGRSGLWLETAVLAGVAYTLGCWCGAALGAPFAVAAESAAAAPLAPVFDIPPRAEAADRETPVESPAAVNPLAAEAAAVIVARELQALMEPAQPAIGAPPPALARPEAGQEDDLRLIRGVDAGLSEMLHAMGVWRFKQIAAWRQEHLDWIANQLRQPPVSLKFWPPQARVLAAGALTDYARAVLEGKASDDGGDTQALAEWVARLPALAPSGAADEFYAGVRPPGFVEPPFGAQDDLTRISGVDGAISLRLNGLGVWTWRQIAHWSAENARWIGAWLARPGAPEREDWIGAARALVAGARAGETKL
ncbi:putative flap endonuclease-1-like 5' DNA nuclease [Rhodoblastus acidophilus]|uniref:hypothetical protein n=1 Tax=Rhodoblastus acidophilus TaxID=1074 RepID=UPI0022252381|nr:hypothetical protein [Rhodoblastus acidophilus]MCW2315367.1 putative flap endonuclease-1-like 5' DNA nuclease [Rhodoblastus acidophilus]